MTTRTLILLLVSLPGAAAATAPRAAEELRFYLHGAPKTVDPLIASDSPSETIRFLTAGVLIRIDRRTQQLRGELAESWKVTPDSRKIEFTLRPGVRFSDGSPVTAGDVAFTMRKVLDPSIHSPIGDAFRSGAGQVKVEIKGARVVTVIFPGPVAQPAALFDPVPVMSERSPTAVAGPYMVAEHKAGSEILLRRNPHYWKRDGQGVQLPYIPSIRIRVQANRELEMLEFERGNIDLIPDLSPDLAERLASKDRNALIDLGLTLDSLVMWFNQVPGSPVAAHKKAWFQSAVFRKAVSMALNREDICRIAYRGKARPGVGPISPANRQWFNASMKADANDSAKAAGLLRTAGFRLNGGWLMDAAGNPVEFSAVTNAGNKTHERILGLVQQDLKRIGIKVTVTMLDFPSLIERITRTFNYEVSMLPLTNISLDPADQMNVWLSSAANHQWNPNQATPATGWEKEIDELMGRFTSSLKFEDRKRAFDRVQELVSRNTPFIYIAHPQAQAAVSPSLKLTGGAPMWPYVLWDLERATARR